MKQPHTAVGNTAKNALVEPPESTGPGKTATWRYDTKAVETAPIFLALEPAALALGVPCTWLKREADAGRIPFLSVGRRRLFNPDAAARALVDRSCTWHSERDQLLHERRKRQHEADWAVAHRPAQTPPPPPPNETMTKGAPPPIRPQTTDVPPLITT